MRFFTGLAGVWLGTGLSLTGAALVIGCGEDFDGCEASRTCASGASSGDASVAGASGGGQAGHSGGGSSGAAAGASGRGGRSSGTNGGEGGESGEEASRGGDAGQAGGTGGTAGKSGGGGRSSGEDGGATGDAGDPGTTTDDEPPHVIATSPGNGDTGVLADVEIVVTFSEPMDNGLTEKAYQSVDLPADAVALSWRENSTKLVIRPKQPLEYADVTTVNADAKHYSFTIAGTAADLASNPLGDDRTFVFTTLRHITHYLNPLGGHGRRITENGSTSYTNKVACDGTNDTLLAGDTDDNTPAMFLVFFDFDDLPDNVESFASAELEAALHTTSHNPYTETRLGSLRGYSVVADAEEVRWDTPASELGVLSDNNHAESGTLDVVEGLRTDYEHRATQGNRSQMLFRFDLKTDDDDTASYVSISCSRLKLHLDYLAP